MKKAAIVVGKAHAGKSTTIRDFRSILGSKMEGLHKFRFFGKRGYILSTSFEEMPRRDIEATVKRYSGYDLLVFACRGAKLDLVHQALRDASFIPHDINVQSVTEARKKAREIIRFFNSN